MLLEVSKSGRGDSLHPLTYFWQPISTCISPDCTPKYEVVSAGDYVKSRLEATYAHSASNPQVATV